MQEIGNMLYQMFLEKCKDKIVEKETLEEYLLSFKKDDLLRLVSAHVLIVEDSKKLSEVYLLRNKSKKEIATYIITKLDDILIPYFEVLSNDVVNELSKIKKSFFELDLYRNIFGFATLMAFKKFSFAKINYNSKNNKVLFYIPQEFISVFQKCTNNEELMKRNKNNNELFERITGFLDIYGVIPLDVLIDICRQNRMNLEYSQLYKLLSVWQILDRGLCVQPYKDKHLVANAGLVDEVISFYENTNKKYKIYTPKQYQLLSQNHLYKHTVSYQKLYEYIEKNFDIDDDFSNEFDNFIVMDYIYSAQLSREKAKENFYHNIDEIFETLTEQEKNKLHSLVFKVFEECPKWYKNGHK